MLSGFNFIGKKPESRQRILSNWLSYTLTKKGIACLMAQDNRKPITAVETVKNLNAADVIELCDAAIGIIESGGGFGWITPPPRNVLEDYWKDIMLIPERELIIGRIDGVVGASCQILRPPRNNEARN